MRKKGTEAKSVGFYVIASIDGVLSIALGLLLGFNVLCLSAWESLNGALISIEGALIGFMITIFALYFTYSMSDTLKERLIAHGFYWQLPRDMLKNIVIFAIGIVSSIVVYFVPSLVKSILIGVSIVQLLSGLALSIFVTIRFFMIVKTKR